MFSLGGLSKSRVLLSRQGTTTTSPTTLLLRQQPALLQQQHAHQLQKVRRMGGGQYMHVNETHTQLGEAFGVVCWLWVFYRARSDLPVMYGFRHPWEHAPDPFAPDHHGHGHGDPDAQHKMEESWDKFSAKAMKIGEDDDDEEEEEEGDDDDEE